MEKLQKANVVIPRTSKDDPRVGQLLGAALKSNAPHQAVILGFPSDEGVKRNGGRPGASKAPDKIRQELYKLTPPAEETQLFINLIEHTSDIGNVNITADLASAQERLAKIIAEYLKQGVIPILLGGGHETAYGHFLGYAEADLPTAIFNLDAHTDVRPLINGQSHSGSPFRQALEHESGCAESYLVAGLQSHAVAKSQLDYIEQAGGRVYFRDETNITSISGLLHQHESERLMVTFDMDAVDQAQAPGVSAPCANGLHSDLWLTAAYLAGRNEQVTSFDLSEVNPEYDRDGQTAKLAALTVWHFLLGVSQR